MENGIICACQCQTCNSYSEPHMLQQDARSKKTLDLNLRTWNLPKMNKASLQRFTKHNASDTEKEI